MREIKFRAWNKSNVMMMDVEKYSFKTNQVYFDSEWWEEFELMQYTGLKDKNGKEIYEGDIIDIHQTVNGCNLFVIVWKDIGFSGLYLIDGEMSIEYEYDIKELLEVNVNKYDKEIEVIGNIRENL